MLIVFFRFILPIEAYFSDTMPGTSQLASLVVGLTVGNILGIYLAQTYELPDLHSLGQTIFSKAKEFEKSRSDDSKEK